MTLDVSDVMRAWRVTELGEPRDVLRLVEVPTPTAGPGQLLVRVRSSAANFPDALICRGGYQMRPELPFTPGVELCGDVVATGMDVTRFAVGDRIMGGAAIPAGAFADFALVDEAVAFPAPPQLDDDQAAAFTFAYQTGWFGLHRRARLQPGETLLVHAAAGGVGSAAVQLGKAAGAFVIGVVGDPRKVEFARQSGADAVVDRTSDNFVEVVKRLTDDRGADVVYDPVGGEAFAKSTKCIAFEGRIVVVGFAGGYIQSAALNHALVKNYSIDGLHWGLYSSKAPKLLAGAHDALMTLVAKGTVSPLMEERLGFEQVPSGLQRLADGGTVGRVTFRV